MSLPFYQAALQDETSFPIVQLVNNYRSHKSILEARDAILLVLAFENHRSTNPPWCDVWLGSLPTVLRGQAS